MNIYVVYYVFGEGDSYAVAYDCEYFSTKEKAEKFVIENHNPNYNKKLSNLFYENKEKAEKEFEENEYDYGDRTDYFIIETELK